MAASVKVLVVGAVNGRLDVLATRVAQVNAAHGPFDVVLCAGGIFSTDPVENMALEPFLAGDRTCP
jgi:hypothetical protein